MSTYLKSAAMSLLSKTLQAFLKKYLSDVDVEGVTLPSYDGSGWGFQLSNVQLREGVQLMKTMPGRVVKKRTVKRRRLRKRKLNSVVAQVNKTDEAEETTQSDDPRSERNCAGVGKESRTRLNSIEDGDVNTFPRRARTNSAMTTADFEIVGSTSSLDYYSDDEIENDSGGDRKPSTRVPIPNRIFACFSSRNSNKEGGNQLHDHSIHQGKDKRQCDVDEKSASSGGPLSVNPSEMVLADSHSSGEAGTVGKQNDGFKTEGSNPIIDHADKNSDDGEGFYEYYEVEEDFEEELELPLQLCLGEHGRIGVVDVRLIGKELNVMVEDAMITIEAIPIASKDEDIEVDECHGTSNESSSAENKDNASSLKESGKTIIEEVDVQDSNVSTSETKTSTKTSKSKPKRDTVGDRVLADNGLARIISSIPHLFLRDVCIRLVVRDEPTAETFMEDKGNAPDSSSSNISNASTEKDDVERCPKSLPSSNDTMVELVVDFLSVTSGEDILSRFQQAHTTVEDDLQNVANDSDVLDSSSSASVADSASTKPPSLLKIPSNFVDANGEHKNEYLLRHIRTGRGPSAGISIQLFVPDHRFSKTGTKSTVSSGDVWARQHWISATNNYLLRCSGLDIQARIHMGTKRVDAGYSWFYGEYVEEDDDISEIDSILLFGGMENVAPGPQLPLPPAPSVPVPPSEPRMSRGGTPRKNELRHMHNDKYVARGTEMEAMQKPASSIQTGMDVYHIDANGIQSCRVPSLFHRVGRGMVLKSCKDCKQNPSEVSDMCWEVPSKSNVKKVSSLDSSIPMPGLTLQICIRDPFEINMDRNSIESIGLINSLFTKPPNLKSTVVSNANKESEQRNNVTEPVTATSITEDTTQTTTASTGFFSGLLYGKPEETIHEEEALEDSFESYMQPESISVVGIYSAEAIIRIHVMQKDEYDRNLSFCYWQIHQRCLTIDRQTLATPERSFSDLKIDIARLVWDEYKGASMKNVMSIGLVKHDGNIRRCVSATSISSMIDDHEQNKAPWPSTACALLNITPPAESLAFKSREGHGLQLRFISNLSGTKSDIDQISRSMLYVRLGLTTIDSHWKIQNEIGVTVSEIMRCLRGPRRSGMSTTGETKVNKEVQKSANNDAVENEAPRLRSLMMYTIQVDSGNISLPPFVEVKMPLTRFSGERSSLAGFSIEAALEKIEFAYGSKELKPKKQPPLLSQVAELPEKLRLHILLCLKDLSPLEIALNSKKEKNSFRRLKSIDKAILKTAKRTNKRLAKSARKKKSSSQIGSLPSRELLLDSANRRQRILTEIMKLDDSELTNLWSVHQRYQKKLAEKLRQS